VIWCFLDGTGVIKGAFARRRTLTDDAEARRYLVWASIVVICAWPYPIWTLARPYIRRRAA
jgi:hypothetical protein